MNINPAAFPTNGLDYEDGMTLRDWFAGQAVSGMLASITRDREGVANLSGSNFAISAYTIADAMLAERAKASN